MQVDKLKKHSKVDHPYQTHLDLEEYLCTKYVLIEAGQSLTIQGLCGGIQAYINQYNRSIDHRLLPSGPNVEPACHTIDLYETRRTLALRSP